VDLIIVVVVVVFIEMEENRHVGEKKTRGEGEYV
jgi:hypothetical protein